MPQPQAKPAVAETTVNYVIIQQPPQLPVYENFTNGQRWGTWALNALTLNGLGSWAIMGDVLGGFVHLGFGLAAVVSLIGSATPDCSNGYGYYYEDCPTTYDDTWFTIFYVSGACWNIFRSVTYNKPTKRMAYNKYGDINLAVLPNRHGNWNTFVMYNKTF
jgi:hypothetical protein